MRLLILIALVCISASGFCEKGPFQSTFQIQFQEISSSKEWADILTQSTESNKLIFVDISTDWCKPCQELQSKVYTDANLGDQFNKEFINLKLNAESDFGQILVNRLGISSYPTLLFLTPKEQAIEKVEGLISIEALDAYALQSVDNWKAYPELIFKKENAQLTKEDYLRLISIYEKMSPTEANELASSYISSLSDDDYQDIEHLWLVSKYQNTLNAAPYQFIKAHKDSILNWHGESEYFNYMSTLYNDNLSLAITYGDKDLLEQLIVELLPEIVAKDAMPRALFSTRSVYYAQREEYDEYRLQVNAFMSNHLSEDGKISFILSTTYDILENYSSEENIVFVDGILNSGLRINSESFEVNSLLGYVKALQEDYKKASELLKKAENLATDAEEKEMISSLIEAVDIMQNGN